MAKQIIIDDRVLEEDQYSEEFLRELEAEDKEEN